MDALNRVEEEVMKKPSVLIVDSDPKNFDFLEMLLEKDGYQLHYSSSGMVAMSSLDLFKPDVILLDILLPSMDGVKVCAQIKSMPDWRSVPIIIFTELTSKQNLAKCLVAGADDFISKPASALELRARIHSMLRIKAQYDDLKAYVEAQQAAIRAMKENLRELRGNQVYAISQELNTPVSTTASTLNRLITRLESLSLEEIRKDLNIARASVGRLQELTDHVVQHYVMQTSKPTCSSYS